MESKANNVINLEISRNEFIKNIKEKGKRLIPILIGSFVIIFFQVDEFNSNLILIYGSVFLIALSIGPLYWNHLYKNFKNGYIKISDSEVELFYRNKISTFKYSELNYVRVPMKNELLDYILY